MCACVRVHATAQRLNGGSLEEVEVERLRAARDEPLAVPRAVRRRVRHRHARQPADDREVAVARRHATLDARHVGRRELVRRLVEEQREARDAHLHRCVHPLLTPTCRRGRRH